MPAKLRTACSSRPEAQTDSQVATRFVRSLAWLVVHLFHVFRVPVGSSTSQQIILIVMISCDNYTTSRYRVHDKWELGKVK